MALHKTPLRYPGGKQRLAPFIREVLEASNLAGGDYIEPFAGGAGVAIELLLSDAVSKIHLNDLCYHVYAFWNTVLEQPEQFCRRIASASLTLGEWRRQKQILASPENHSILDSAFSFFFLNRCNRSGIISGGCIGGLKQTGPWKLNARFPCNELIRRIELIASKRDSIVVRNSEAVSFLEGYVSKLPRKSLVYCDPPYINKADRLYLNHYQADDHKELARVIKKVSLPWLVSYDAVPEVAQLYAKQRSFTYDLQYNAGKVYRGRETFILSPKVKLPPASVLPCINAAINAKSTSAVLA